MRKLVGVCVCVYANLNSSAYLQIKGRRKMKENRFYLEK